LKAIEVIYQDKSILVVNKPPGISVHNNEDPENLLSVLAKQLKLGPLLPVHRLDKETSGLQILAFDAEGAKALATEFQNRAVKKIYQGILRGQLKIKQGVWSRPLTDKAEGRKNPEGKSPDRQPCETMFKVIGESQYFSLCEFDLKTGRQHQIRKHAALANHALVGDPRYGESKYNEKMAKLLSEPRMFLHCSEISLLGKTFLASLPESFQKISTTKVTHGDNIIAKNFRG